MLRTQYNFQAMEIFIITIIIKHELNNNSNNKKAMSIRPITFNIQITIMALPVVLSRHCPNHCTNTNPNPTPKPKNFEPNHFNIGNYRTDRQNHTYIMHRSEQLHMVTYTKYGTIFNAKFCHQVSDN